MDNSETKTRRREQGMRLVRLRREAGKHIPAWLNGSARSILEGTSTLLAGELEGDPDLLGDGEDQDQAAAGPNIPGRRQAVQGL